MDHLLAIPLNPFEIAMARVWANGLVIAVAAGLSLVFVVPFWMLQSAAPRRSSCSGSAFIFSSRGQIFVATIARTMPQLGLLYILVAMPMNILSGSNTPLDSQPDWV